MAIGDITDRYVVCVAGVISIFAKFARFIPPAPGAVGGVVVLRTSVPYTPVLDTELLEKKHCAVINMRSLAEVVMGAV